MKCRRYPAAKCEAPGVCSSRDVRYCERRVRELVDETVTWQRASREFWQGVAASRRRGWRR